MINLETDYNLAILNLSGIYKITNTINSKVYIGCSTHILPRLYSHLNKSSNWLLRRDIKKYGAKSFLFSVLELIDDKEDLERREEDYILLYDSRNPNKGYNISFKGQAIKHEINSNTTNPVGKRTSNRSSRVSDFYNYKRLADLSSKAMVKGATVKLNSELTEDELADLLDE